MKKSLRPTTLALASLACLAGTALAQTAPDPAPAAVNPQVSLVVVRDAETGQLRAPTAAELKALSESSAKTARRASPQRPLPKVHPSGAQGARLTDEFANYLVVVRRADGTLHTEHVEGRKAADAATRAATAPRPAPATAPTE